jgi:hypothetical protein
MIPLPRPEYTGYGRTARDIRAVTSDEQESEVRRKKSESRRQKAESPCLSFSLLASDF